jgi:uncharacterized protein (TIGR03437 family)
MNKRGLLKVIHQSIQSDRVYRSRLFALASLCILGPLVCPAQAPPPYTISTVAGQGSPTGTFAGDGGAATSASLWGPADVIFDSSGNLYIADANNNVIRQVNSGGTISTIAGICSATPCAGAFSGDGGAATSAGLNSPSGLAFDSSGNLYIADTGNYEIRKVAGGNISTVAGENSLGAGFGGDLAAATSAKLWNPSSVAVDSAGNIYIADPYNNVVRVVCQTQTSIACTNNAFVNSTGYVIWAAGDINTFAGSNINEVNGESNPGYTGDGGLSTGALINNPAAVLLDAAGDLYISDSGNNAIRMVNPTGTITTVVGDGSGVAGYLGDGGPATKARLNNPKGIALDSSGNLYIADCDNSVIRMVEPNGTITTIAGNSTPGFSGDGGAATSAQLNFPSGVAVNGGKIYIADNANNAIRLLTPVAQVPQINAGGVVNGASYTAPVAPGSIATVFGGFFLSSPSGATTLPLTISLENLSLQFSGGTQAPLYFVSGPQVNLQVPWELAGQSTASLAATLNGATGATQTVNLASAAPAIFTTNSQGTGQGAILDSSYHLVDSSNPATAGTTYILIYCTGLGAVKDNQPATGAPASLTAQAETATTPTVTIGGVTANVSFSGLAPGYVGLYQVNALVPAGVAAGSAVPVAISMGDVISNTVTIAVQ